jgi:pimeloyl-ACP methyl ester carboxylesterase
MNNVREKDDLSRSRAARWSWVFWFVVTVAILLLAGSLYQFISTRRDNHKYPPPGKLVDVGGYRLHLFCAGSKHPNEPTVVLDAGLGDCSLIWSLVQSQIAGFTEVCSYDRAGLGWSDPGPEPRTSRVMVEELHTLLHNAGVEGPYVLVGHSFGGANVQLFASTWPDEVAGLVLVDSAHEDQANGRSTRGPLWYRMGLMTAPLGIPRLFAPYFSDLPAFDDPSKFSSEVRSSYQAVLTHTSHLYTLRQEMAGVEESFEQLRDAPRQFGNKPLIVLTSTTMFGKPKESLTGEEKEYDLVWKRLQSELAGLSTNSRQVIAEHSGHFIQYDQPELVIQSVKEIVDRSCGSSIGPKH